MNIILNLVTSMIIRLLKDTFEVSYSLFKLNLGLVIENSDLRRHLI